jgi:hypothetical protein
MHCELDERLHMHDIRDDMLNSVVVLTVMSDKIKSLTLGNTI